MMMNSRTCDRHLRFHTQHPGSSFKDGKNVRCQTQKLGPGSTLENEATKDRIITEWSNAARH